MLQNRRIDTQRVLEKLNELFAVNDTAKALQHLHYWLSEAEAAKDDRAILLFYNELMGLYRKLGEKARATEYAQKALAQTEKMNIRQNVGAATTYLNCATVYKAFERAADALSLYEKAREIYERELDGADDRLAGLYNNMALALVDLLQITQGNQQIKLVHVDGLVGLHAHDGQIDRPQAQLREDAGKDGRNAAICNRFCPAQAQPP